MTCSNLSLLHLHSSLHSTMIHIQHAISGALLGVLLMGSVAFAQPSTPTKVPTKISIQSGERVAFLGASITEFGWNDAEGYVRLVFNNLAANGINIVAIPAGVSGNTSRDMLARLERDVLAKKPNWVLIDAGGNDVWHNSVDFAEYMKNMTAIVEASQKAGVKVVIQTCTPIGEDLKNEFNPKLDTYNTFLRYLADQKHYLLADLNADSVKLLKTKTNADNLLTTDGVHMNERGNKVMAIGVLKTFGLTDEQIAKTIPLER